MLKIRLQRVGRIHEPAFRLVLTDSKNSTKSGRFNEILGSYDPRKSADSLKSERISYWLSQGALPTPTVHNLLVKHGILRAKKIHTASPLKGKPEVPVVETPAVETPVESTPEATPEVAPEAEASKEGAEVVQ